MTYTSARIMFDSLEAAVETLLVVLEDALGTVFNYSFGGLSAEQVYASGLVLVGEIHEVVPKIVEIEGTTLYEE